MQNTWRDVPGFDGRYQVSKDGQVRAMHGRWREHVMRPSLSGYSEGWVRYHQLGLTRSPGKREHWYVHRLVLLAFVGPKPEGKEGRHLNGDPLDDRLVNLAYGTHGENTRDMVAHGTHNQARKTHCKNGHEFTEENTLLLHRRGGVERACRACNRSRQRR